MNNGTEKQVAWAEKIRAEFIAEVRKFHASKRVAAEKAGQLSIWNEIENRAITDAMADNDAMYWINNRAELGLFNTVGKARYHAAQNAIKALHS